MRSEVGITCVRVISFRSKRLQLTSLTKFCLSRLNELKDEAKNRRRSDRNQTKTNGKARNPRLDFPQTNRNVNKPTKKKRACVVGYNKLYTDGSGRLALSSSLRFRSGTCRQRTPREIRYVTILFLVYFILSVPEQRLSLFHTLPEIPLVSLHK